MSSAVLTPNTSFSEEKTRYVPTDSESVTTDLSLANEDVILMSLRSRWREAVIRWEGKLLVNSDKDNPNRKAIAEFRSWDDLIADLRKRQEDAQQSRYHGIINRVYPYLEAIDKLFPVLVSTIALPGKAKETTMVWAILYIGIKATIVSEDLFRSIVESLDKLELQLRTFDRYVACLNRHVRSKDSNREIGAAVVNMFELIIDFWTSAVGKFSIQEAWCLQKSEKVVTKVTEAVERVHSFLREVALELALENKSQEANGLAGLGFLDDARTTFPCVKIPPPRKCFQGRDEHLKAIKKQFIESEKTNNFRSFAIYGLGGVGKTSLALNFAHYCRENKKYDAIFWLNGETPFALRQSFTDIAYCLELSRPGMNEDHESNVLLVQNWLCKTNKSWLLIFDNVEDSELLKQHLPSAPGPILITTRYRNVALNVGGIYKTVELLPFDKAQSEMLFSALRKQYRQDPTIVDEPSSEEKAATEELMEILGGLAVGIEHMAAYIESDNLTIIEFLKKYNRMALDIHKRENTGSNAPHTLDKVWKMSFDRVLGESPNAYNCLCILSTMSPDAIPLSLFNLEDEEDEVEIGNTLTAYSSFCDGYAKIENAVTILKNVALIRRTGDVISIHRLLQKSLFCGLGQEESQKAFDASVKLVNHAFPKSVNGRPLLDQWPACESAIQHALALANRFHEASKMKKKQQRLATSPELQELMKNCVWYLFEMGEFNDALRLLEIAYTICPDKGSLVYAHLCNSAAVIYFELNDLKKCKIKNDIAFTIRDRLLPKDDLELANCYHNQGLLEGARGRQDESLAFLHLAEQARIKAGEEALISLGLGNLISGRALFLKSQFREAIERYEKAGQLFAATLGPKSQLSAHLLYAHGNLELAQGQTLNAKVDYEDGYKMSADLSPTHILTATFQYKLGVVEAVLGNYIKALEYLNKALEITETRGMKGDSARINRRKALIIEENPTSTAEQKSNAASYKLQAELAKIELVEANGLENLDAESEDRAYDQLVCGYYR